MYVCGNTETPHSVICTSLIYTTGWWLWKAFVWEIKGRTAFPSPNLSHLFAVDGLVLHQAATRETCAAAWTHALRLRYRRPPARTYCIAHHLIYTHTHAEPTAPACHHQHVSEDLYYMIHADSKFRTQRQGIVSRARLFLAGKRLSELQIRRKCTSHCCTAVVCSRFLSRVVNSWWWLWVNAAAFHQRTAKRYCLRFNLVGIQM